MAEYKIKDLERLTGIKAHTIRIWEKRYGILNPTRTETQIRSYNDEELKYLMNIALLYNHGSKISKLALFSPSQIENQVKTIVFNHIEETAIDELIKGLLDMDEIRFNRILNELFTKNTVANVYSKYIIPFLEKMGYLWQVGSIHPGQEHFISNILRQKIISAIDRLPTPTNTDKRVMLYLPEHEWHELTLLIYQHHLRLNGYRTYYFGQAMPFHALKDIISSIRPTHIVTSWITQVDPEFLIHHMHELVKLTSVPVFLSGNQAIPLFDRLPKTLIPIRQLQDLNPIH